MTIVDSLVRPFGLQPRSVKVAAPATRPVVWGGTDDDLVSISEEASIYERAAKAYTTNDLVYACLTKLGDMAGSSKLMLFSPDVEVDPDVGHPIVSAAIPRKDHPFYALFASPNASTTRHNFMKRLFISYILSDKGSFTHIDDGQREPENNAMQSIQIGFEGTPQALWNLLPFRVTPKKGKKTVLSKFVVDRDTTGPTYYFAPEAIMWLRDVDPLDDFSSVSRYQPVQKAVDFDQYASLANVQLFRNALRPSAVIEAERQWVDPDEIAMLQKLWEDQLKGAENWHKLLPLWGGFKLKTIGFSPGEAEYIAGSKMARTRIFATFGVHPGLILSENVNLANARVADIVTRRYTLQPILQGIADGFTSQILPLYGKEAPPAHAYFVNVVPEDKQQMYSLFTQRGNASKGFAEATLAWVKVLGPVEGLQEAARAGLLSEDINLPAVTAYLSMMPEEIKAALYADTQDSSEISESDIQKVLSIWDSMFEEGLLDAEPKNPLR